MKNFFHKILRGLSQAFFPEGFKCNCCGDELPRETKYSFCEKCFKKLTFCGADICRKCGSFMENASDFCQTCKSAERPFDLARGVLFYSGDAARLIKNYKSGDKFLAPYFAGMMYDYYLENLAEHKPGAVCFVPCGKKRLKERGYNQSEVLARLLCEKADLPLYNCLEQTRAVNKQALLKAAERAENVKGAYAVPDGRPAYNLTGKNIMLIDDIFTTGGTSGECARVLKQAGAEKVLVFTLATGKGL